MADELFLVCSHGHRYLSSGDYFPNTLAVFTPAWQLATEYVMKLQPEAEDLADIGGLLFECDRGDVGMTRILYRPKETAPWRKQRKRT